MALPEVTGHPPPVSRSRVRDGPLERARHGQPPPKLEPFNGYLFGRLIEFPELRAAACGSRAQALAVPYPDQTGTLMVSLS